MTITAVNKETHEAGVGLRLVQLGRMASRQLRAALAPIRLTPPHAAVLAQLSEEGPISQRALGEALDLDSNNLVGLLNDLEADGLAVRRRDPDDRRRHIVEISARGSTRLADADRAIVATEARLLDALDDDQRRDLEELLARIAEATKKSGLIRAAD